jgi:hypothetical protein
VRLTAAETYRRPQAVVNFLKELYSFCRRAQGKKLLLSVLPDFACIEGLEFCQSLVCDPGVGNEAGTVVDRIKKRLDKLRAFY